jgi:Cdc6-like AAA superfamily ATPase
MAIDMVLSRLNRSSFFINVLIAKVWNLDSNFLMFVTTHSLNQHGIVLGTYDKLEIRKVIDEVLPELEQNKLAHAIRKC